MKLVSLDLSMERRAVHLSGHLHGSVVLAKPTKAHGHPNQWWDDILKGLRALGFTVKAGDDVVYESALSMELLSSVLCHTEDSGLFTNPETADKVAAFITKNYSVTAR